MGFAEFRKQQMRQKKASQTVVGKIILVLPEGDEIEMNVENGIISSTDVKEIEKKSEMTELFYEENGVLVNDLLPGKRYSLRGKQTIVRKNPDSIIGFGCPDEVLLHKPPDSQLRHPELPSRVVNTIRLLRSVNVIQLMFQIAPTPITLNQLSLTHSVDLLSSVFPTCLQLRNNFSIKPLYPSSLYKIGMGVISLRDNISCVESGSYPNNLYCNQTNDSTLEIQPDDNTGSQYPENLYNTIEEKQRSKTKTVAVVETPLLRDSQDQNIKSYTEGHYGSLACDDGMLLSCSKGKNLTKNNVFAYPSESLYNISPKTVQFPSDTYRNIHSEEAVEKSVGTLLGACQSVIRKHIKSAFCLIRPPGHHCCGSAPSGFCLVNNVAAVVNILKNESRDRIPRIAILDWDVHHGDGTQEIFKNDPSVLFISMHRFDGGAFYPHTGSAEGVGRHGNIFNIAYNTKKPNQLISDTSFDVCSKYFVIPLLKKWSPDLVIVSAGYDAAKGDPLGQQSVVHGFSQMTSSLMTLSCGLVFALEGGYNSDSVSQGVLSCIKVLHGYPPPKTFTSSPEHQKWSLETVLNTLTVTRPESFLTSTIKEMAENIIKQIKSLN